MRVSLAVGNLRRIEKMPDVELRPITLLLGRNSSGKSTFLRTLPLIKQSVTARTSAPLLWYGQLVDFGDYSTAVHNNDERNRIYLRFCFENSPGRPVRISNRTPLPYFSNPYTDIPSFNASFEIASRERKTYLSAIDIQSQSRRLNARILLEGITRRITSIKIDDNEMIDTFKSGTLRLRGYSFASPIQFLSSDRGTATYRYDLAEFPIATSIATIIKPHLDARIKPDTLTSLALTLLRLDSFDSSSLHECAARTQNRSFEKLLSRLAEHDQWPLYSSIRSLYLLYDCIRTVNSSAELIAHLFSRSQYIGPARARSERFYRYQELELSEIDPDGRNFPMFLNSLSESQLRRFSDWTLRLFGYGVSLDRTGGHISINLVSHGDRSTNVVDTGYGVSQILPVLGQIWASQAVFPRTSARALRGTTPQFIAIEQPELHLHPAHQGMLADMLAETVKQGNERDDAIHFVIETHSEALVNKIGQLIYNNKLSPDDVQIVIFNTDDNDRNLTTLSSYDEEGNLVDWPYGFFSYE